MMSAGVDRHRNHNKKESLPMTNVFLFTCGDAEALANYNKTVGGGIDVSQVLPLLQDDGLVQTIRDHSPDGKCSLWGAKNGDRNRSTWEQMTAGDTVLGYRRGSLLCAATVIGKEDNSALAEQVWGSNGAAPFQLVYFLSEPRACDVPVASLEEHLPSNIRGFSKVTDDKVENMIRDYGSVENFVQQGLLGQSVSDDSHVSDPWGEFVEWCRRFLAQPDFQEREIDPKLLLGSKLSQVKEAVIRDDVNWADLVREPFRSKYGNFVRWPVRKALFDWIETDPLSARRSLMSLWADPEKDVLKRIEENMAQLPIEIGRSLGNRLALAAFLLAAESPEKWPIYRVTPLSSAADLCGYPKLPTKSDERTRYAWTLAFLDRLIDEASARDLDLPNRLYAQSAVWCVTKYSPPEDWSPDLRQQLINYRKQGSPSNAVELVEAWVTKLRTQLSPDHRFYYKPTLVLALTDLMEDEPDHDNSFAYEELLPRFKHCIEQANASFNESQFSQAYVRLKNDVAPIPVWLPEVSDPDAIEDRSADLPSYVMTEVPSIQIDEQVWTVFASAEGRVAIREVIARQWTPPGSQEGGTPSDREKRIWAIALGERARLWNECQEDGIIAIGWDYLGDLSAYKSREEITAAIIDHEHPTEKPTNNSLCCWEFAHQMRIGDYVISKLGRKRILGIGVITSDYILDASRSEYHHTRRVKWLKARAIDLPEDTWLPTKTLTDTTDYHAFVEIVTENYLAEEPTISPEREKPFTVADAMAGLFMDQVEFEGILDDLRQKKNVILQGPPGVGKTFIAKRLAWSLLGAKDESRVAMVQFHQSYAYEDFIQGWRPTSGGGFELRNGVFYDFCDQARVDRGRPYVFIIDEINRGNLSRIFGELMMLIEPDKRGADNAIPLTYSESGEQFSVPENLHILGLMNTADRSLAMVDYALRRRFRFSDLRPRYEHPAFRQHLEKAGISQQTIRAIIARMTALNKKIEEDHKNLGPGFTIGQSFFCHSRPEDCSDASWYQLVIEREIAPLLEEYWFDRRPTAVEWVASLQLNEDSDT